MKTIKEYALMLTSQLSKEELIDLYARFDGSELDEFADVIREECMKAKLKADGLQVLNLQTLTWMNKKDIR